MANLSKRTLQVVGTLWEALQRLETCFGGWEPLTRAVDQIVNDPYRRQQVFLALNGQLVAAAMSKAEWVEREMAVLVQLATLGLPEITTARLEPAWTDGVGLHHRYLPGDWNQRGLLDACKAAGIKMCSLNTRDEELPTERGVIEYDLTSIMTPTDGEHRPFMLSYQEQIEWAAGQDGEGITSVEETLYLILRVKVELGRLPFMGGWIRCRNTAAPDESLGVFWYADFGLEVCSVFREYSCWYWGAVPRKFRRV